MATNNGTNLSYSASMFLSTAVVFFATALIAVWMLGSLSEGGTGSLEYIVRPPQIPGWTITSLGIVGLVAVATIAWMTRAQPNTTGVILLSAIAGALAGSCYRLITAGVIGANIGGGLAIVVGAPLAFAILATAVTIAVKKRPRG